MSVASKVRVLESVDFHGQALVVISRDNEPYVAMRPIVEGMGLTWPSQYQKLMDNKDRWGGMMIITPSQGGDQTTLCMPLRKLMGWLMTLQPSRMDEEVAKKVLIYQNECDDMLWAYWKNGIAVNPRAQFPENPTALGLPDFNDPIAAAEGWLIEAKGRKAAERGLQLAQAAVKQLEVRAA